MRFGGHTDVRGAESHDLVEAVQRDVILVAGFFCRVYLENTGLGKTCIIHIGARGILVYKNSTSLECLVINNNLYC